MVLVDTSVWIHHFRRAESHLTKLLLSGEVVCHPFIIEELACGNIRNRKEILSLLQTLPSVITVDHDEALFFIQEHHMEGIGVGIVDMHILASTMLTHLPLWTMDKALQVAAERVGVLYRWTTFSR